jgi:hypothetical protein
VYATVSKKAGAESTQRVMRVILIARFTAGPFRLLTSRGDSLCPEPQIMSQPEAQLSGFGKSQTNRGR